MSHRPGSKNAGGLVGLTQWAVITGCTTNVTVTGREHVGGLIGWQRPNDVPIYDCHTSGSVIGYTWLGGLIGNAEGTVIACSSDAAVSQVIATNGNQAGGLVGINTGNVVMCSAGGVLTGNTNVGGLVGYNDGLIQDCYASSSGTGGVNTGGLVGGNNGTVNRCYSFGNVAGTVNAGGMIGNGLTGTVTASFYNVETSAPGGDGGEAKSTAEMSGFATYLDAGWDFAGLDSAPADLWVLQPGTYPELWWKAILVPVLPSFGGGDGTPENPYQITNADELNMIGVNPRLVKAYYVLTADVDMSGVSTFYALGDELFPFEGRFDGAGHSISNLRITGSGDNVGLVRVLHSSVVTGDYQSLTGINLVDPTIDGAAWDNVGALLGYLKGGSVSECSVTGGQVSGSGDNIGGLIGYNAASIVTAFSSSCNVVSLGNNVGGVVGNSFISVENSFSQGNISGHDNTGGVVGLSEGRSTTTVRGCYSTGTVTGNDNVGGVAGKATGMGVRTSYSTGSVSGQSQVGGIAGDLQGGAIVCMSSANVTASGDYAGGIAGSNMITALQECYANGDISAASGAGGISGMSSSTIMQCYFAGRILSDTVAGGLTGDNRATISACVWDVDVSGKTNMCGAAGGSGCNDSFGKTTEEMKSEGTFSSLGWNFTNYWTMGPCDGLNYPLLQWEGDEGAQMPSFAAGSGTVEDPYLVATVEQLRNIGRCTIFMDKHFALIANIDLSEVDWVPIGDNDTRFSGTFDGNGHVISNLHVAEMDHNGAGLFGQIRGAGSKVVNLGMFNSHVEAGEYSSSGSIVGWLREGEIVNCFSIGGTVSGQQSVGGLVGYSDRSAVRLCYAHVDVTGNSSVGGLVGNNRGQFFNTTVGIIEQCYSAGSVVGVDWVYPDQSVEPAERIGGLVGLNDSNTQVIDSVWDVTESGHTNMCGADWSGASACDDTKGWTSEQMMTQSMFESEGWDFTTPIWAICEGMQRPRFSWQILDGDVVCPFGVEMGDFALIADNWERSDCSEGNNWCDGADADHSGTVGIADAVAVFSEWLGGIDF